MGGGMRMEDFASEAHLVTEKDHGTVGRGVRHAEWPSWWNIRIRSRANEHVEIAHPTSPENQWEEEQETVLQEKNARHGITIWHRRTAELHERRTSLELESGSEDHRIEVRCSRGRCYFDNRPRRRQVYL